MYVICISFSDANKIQENANTFRGVKQVGHPYITITHSRIFNNFKFLD